MRDITNENHGHVEYIDLDAIRPNPYQPRKHFDQEKLADLAASIREHGVLQPIILRKTVQGYHIVVGERRFRASHLAGLNSVPAIVKEMSDAKMMELAIIENLQREDLNAIEEAESYRKLMDDLHITQKEVAERLGKSRPYIANMLRLLNLPSAVAGWVKDGKLSGAHGRTLLILKDETKMKQIAKQVMKEAWSVRYLEQHIAELTSPTSEDDAKKKTKKPRMIERQERLLKERFGTNVAITTKRNKGQITFEFKSEEEFKRLIQQLHSET
ncbi:ParB/RepB/Spo0J family partition protein [Staphylococcus simulans]|uniref:ParB/RepB/Spo0J family partition protein n=1 Tax=Staphylococcus simulans TaxID=1286 RepID=UPI0021CE607C|nr:ParB/RepB/Spo0J family partition protein [Staphylococcus simulans]UXV37543.1 ParB/RepB/Spo0J family partition protein [Staphylococcus simulans]UXV39991.1 ParB/RepB/Spo0J family partition protein [Staphylococcus simulans]